uniref:Uncharacterized protein n=1 Tax=Anguilla anguilla TaxID=7936 RepID=A0A0E9T016_ANGAN
MNRTNCCGLGLSFSFFFFFSPPAAQCLTILFAAASYSKSEVLNVVVVAAALDGITEITSFIIYIFKSKLK